MAPRFPFSPVLLAVQVLYGGMGVFAVTIGERIGWVAIIMTLLLTLHMSRIYNESSTNPEHDEIINRLAGLDIKLQDAAWKNKFTNGENWDEIRRLEAVYKEYHARVELDHDGLYRYKK